MSGMNTEKESGKRRRGRPPTGGPKPLRTYRMDHDEFNEIVEAAENLGVSISEFTRQTLLRRARRVNREHAD